MNWDKKDFESEFDRQFRDTAKAFKTMWLVNTILGILAVLAFCGGGSWLVIRLAEIIFQGR